MLWIVRLAYSCCLSDSLLVMFSDLPYKRQFAVFVQGFPVQMDWGACGVEVGNTDSDLEAYDLQWTVALHWKG